MKKKNKIKTAVIGLGVGAHLARTLSLNPNVELTSLCDINETRLKEIGSTLTEAKLIKNSNDVLQDPEINLVCIASYDQFHFEQVIMALENGKNVYVEKPLCLSKNEIKDIRKKLNENPHLRLSSNMVLRTCPLFIKVRENIKSTMMGEIYHIEADYLFGRKEKLTSGWRADADVYSIIYGAAVHMVDLTMWLIGKKPLRVQALGNRITTAGTKQKNNDFAVMLFEFEDQMSIKISAHGGCVHPHFHTLKVFGTNSSFIHESTGTVWVQSSDPNQKFIYEKEEYPAKTKRDGTLISFLDSLINFDKKVMVSEMEVFDTMSVCLAAEQAVRTGEVVEIDYL